MITIHATKKLYAKLPTNISSGLAKDTTRAPLSPAMPYNPLNGWHANLLTLQRRNCVLLVHDETRFPLLIKSMLKADFAQFDYWFDDAFMNTLLKLDANQTQLDNAAKWLAPCVFDTMCNRSLQGTMNQMAGDIETKLWFDQLHIDDLSAYKAGAWLADRPCNVKGVKDVVWPQKAMLQLLSDSAPSIFH